MFSKLAAVFVFAAAIASAMPTDDPATSVTSTTNINKCNVGKLQCCQDIQSPHNQAIQNQLGVLGVALGSVDGMVGVKCNPISGLIGAGTGSNCNANPVCCKKNIQNGGLAVGCTPLNVNV